MQEKEMATIIHFHRKKAKLTQQELAQLAGVGKTVIYDIEKGKISIRFKTLLNVLNALNIKIILQSPLINEKTNEKSTDINS